MAEGRQRAVWSHTASLMAMTLNCAFGSDGKAKPEDFSPYARADRERAARLNPPKKVGIGILKAVFIDKDLAAARRMADEAN